MGATATKERPETASGAKKGGNEGKKNDRKRKDGRQKKEKQAKINLNLNAPTFVPNFGSISGVPTGMPPLIQSVATQEGSKPFNIDA